MKGCYTGSLPVTYVILSYDIKNEKREVSKSSSERNMHTQILKKYVQNIDFCFKISLIKMYFFKELLHKIW